MKKKYDYKNVGKAVNRWDHDFGDDKTKINKGIKMFDSDFADKEIGPGIKSFDSGFNNVGVGKALRNYDKKSVDCINIMKKNNPFLKKK